MERCTWCLGDPLYEAYHDKEWGLPVYNDQQLFEHLVLDGAQAGLSWITILRRREHYRTAFDHFDIAKIAAYDENKIAELLQNSGIIRNRQKIRSAINNANRALQIQEEFGSLNAYLWSFVDGEPVVNTWETDSEIPAETELSRAMSKDLKKHGFSFVGPVICYAFMQASGLINDHIITCFRHTECTE